MRNCQSSHIRSNAVLRIKHKVKNDTNFRIFEIIRKRKTKRLSEYLRKRNVMNHYFVSLTVFISICIEEPENNLFRFSLFLPASKWWLINHHGFSGRPKWWLINLSSRAQIRAYTDVRVDEREPSTTFQNSIIISRWKPITWFLLHSVSLVMFNNVVKHWRLTWRQPGGKCEVSILPRASFSCVDSSPKHL